MQPIPKLFSLAYFAPVSWYSLLVSEGPNFVERYDHYQKQTYRNRCVVYSPNGPMPLVIPTVHSKELKQPYSEIRIDDRQKWRQVHRKSIETAYRNSPFFPFFEEELNELYTVQEERLFAFNLRCHEWVERMIQKKIEWEFTTEWKSEFEGRDLRNTIHPKKPSILPNPDEYHQTFDYKHGFLPDLSILDVVFNKGMETLSYLSNNRSKLKL